jgi:hypothetical protein
MRQLTRALITILLTAAGVIAVSTAGASAASACDITWGSIPEADPDMGTGEVDTVRTGRHDCFDRLVIDIDGPSAGYRAEYVDVVYADGSGHPVSVPGGARVAFTVNHPAYSLGLRTGQPAAGVAGFDTFRAVVFGGSFEGQTLLGVGTRARLPFRVFTLAGPGGHSRIVFDVAHRW